MMVKVETGVLVAGAGIAGPALAHWLRRRGAGVTVVERAPGLRPGGQAVDARGVTREVIRRMGLDAAVRAARTETAGAYTVDVDGKVLETYRADDDGGDGYVSEIEILRGDLSRRSIQLSRQTAGCCGSWLPRAPSSSSAHRV
jgi:2-polyprenyl-6-methoxyphenol hydroxylase-like FAD-dependent oxidoreductase